MSTPQWLLLAHQLPARPSNARVKTWRRLQQIGAVVARNSVYVLPNTDQCREDFEWLRSEIVDAGGEATVFAADAVDGRGSTDIVAAFRHAREHDYALLKHDADRLRAAVRRNGNHGASDRTAVARAVRGIRERFSEIDRIDFFHARGRDELLTTISGLEQQIQRPRATAVRPGSPLHAGEYVKRHWVTRPRPGVDRMASAWLIRRFVDPKATFGFVAKPEGSDIAFDIYEGDFSHHGPYCTYEVLMQRFGLTMPAVIRIGQVVHDLDMKETRYAVAEAPAVERMVDGLRALYADDHELLEAGIQIFEALARSFESTERNGSERPVRKKKPGTRRTSRQK